MPDHQKRKVPSPPKSGKRPRKLPEEPMAHSVANTQEATERDIGDTADQITRAPKKKR